MGFYKHQDRRCVTAEQCRNFSRPFFFNENDFPNPYIPFDGSCALSCPVDHYIENDNGKRYCKRCNGPCKKDCLAATIDSIAAAQQYRGCNRITGSLLIQIRSQGGREFVFTIFMLFFFLNKSKLISFFFYYHF